jgi:AcrR family transcriptional regulator
MADGTVDALASTTKRSIRATRNAIALRHAAIEQLAAEGWDARSARTISAAANLSYGAIYARFEHVDDLVADAWHEVLWPALSASLDQAVGTVLQVPDEEAFVAELRQLATPNVEILAAVELVAAALADARAATFVAGDVRAFLERHAGPRGDAAGTEAPVAATVLFLALGLAHMARRSWTAGSDIDEQLRRYHRALVAPGAVVPTPPAAVEEYLYAYRFDDLDDERLERVLLATATSVGEVGYQATTIARICRTANVSSGFVMGRFPSKAQLFERVVAELWGRGLTQIGEYFAARAAELGPTLAEAVVWREVQRPGFAAVAHLNVEISRVAAFVPAVGALLEEREVAYIDSVRDVVPTGYVHVEYALGLGMMLCSLYRPELAALPYACVTAGLVG